MKKSTTIIYRIVTSIFSLHMLLTIGVYFFSHQMVSETFVSLGVPPEIIYPLAVVKLLGLIAIWSNKSSLLKHLAYAGFALDFVFASISHAIADDGGALFPLIALVFLSVSFVYYRKMIAAAAQCIAFVLRDPYSTMIGADVCNFTMGSSRIMV